MSLTGIYQESSFQYRWLNRTGNYYSFKTGRWMIQDEYAKFNGKMMFKSYIL